MLHTPEKQLRIRLGQEPFYFPVSYSRIKEFQECPKRYKFQSIDKLGRISNYGSELGTAAHTFQELLHTEGLDKALSVARTMVPLTKSKDWKNIRTVIEDLSIKKRYLYSSEKSIIWEWTALREEEVWTIQFEAKLDLVFYFPETETVEVVDGKSSKRVESKIDDDPQGAIYGIAVLKELDGLPIKRYVFTQAQWALGRTVSTEFSVEEITEWEVTYNLLAEKMLRETDFDARPGTHCLWCPYVLQCDAAQKLLPDVFKFAGENIPVHVTEENSVRIAQGVLHLEAVTKRLRQGLRGYVTENKVGIETPDGSSFDFHSRTSRKLRNAKAFIEKMEELELDPEPYLSFNGTTGKTLLKQFPQLDPLIIEEHYPWFDHQKTGED